MGKKIPFDQAMKLAGLQISAEMIFDTPNRYGYRVNINHPKILPLYEAYHKHIGVPLHIHLTTPQRLRFEAIIFRMMQKPRR